MNILSIHLIAENIRRYWFIPVGSILAYFMTIILPIVLADTSYSSTTVNSTYSPLEAAAYMVQSILGFQDLNSMLVMLFVPILVALSLFHYLHDIGSTAVIHSMPHKRSTLLSSNILLGLGMTIAPILINGAMLFAIKKPVVIMTQFFEEGATYLTQSSIDVFTNVAIGHWMLYALVVSLWVFAVAVFAAMITSNLYMHLLASIGLLGIVPVIIRIIESFAYRFLYGYTPSAGFHTFMAVISPFSFGVNPTHISLSTLGLGSSWMMIYLGIALVLLAFCYPIYNRRKLERASESIVFRPVALFVSYILTFMGMGLFGLQASTLTRHEYAIYAGCLVGGTFAFALVEVMLTKTLRIFHKNALKRFGIFALCASIFLFCFAIDVFKYQDYVPNAEEVASVTFRQNIFTSFDIYHYVVSTQYHDNSHGNVYHNNITLSAPENIQYMRNIHLNFIEKLAHSKYRQKSVDPTSGQYMFRVTYSLKNGKEVSREYDGFSQDFLAYLPAFDSLMSSEETLAWFKEKRYYNKVN